MKNKKFFLFVSVCVIMISLAGCHQHEWEEATCTTPKKCSECGETEGNELGHKWEEATCTTPKRCSECGEIEGMALGHKFGQYVVTQKATCTEEGTQKANCSVCGEEHIKSIPKLKHTKGKWKITKKATVDEAGVKKLYCSVCNEVIKTKKYKLSAKEIKQKYKERCKVYDYETIARNPDKYLGEYAKLTGEVIQVQSDDSGYVLRVDITRTSWGYTDTIMVYYLADKSAPKILEDDIITMYGFLGGETTYTSVLGASITIPVLYAEYVDIN